MDIISHERFLSADPESEICDWFGDISMYESVKKHLKPSVNRVGKDASSNVTHHIRCVILLDVLLRLCNGRQWLLY